MQLPQAPSIDPKEFLDAIFHYLVAPICVFIAANIGRSIKNNAKKFADDAASEILNKKMPEIKRIVDDSNDELLIRINGTYVRSKEQEIRHQNMIDRLTRIEHLLDSKQKVN